MHNRRWSDPQPTPPLPTWDQRAMRLVADRRTEIPGGSAKAPECFLPPDWIPEYDSERCCIAHDIPAGEPRARASGTQPRAITRPGRTIDDTVLPGWVRVCTWAILSIGGWLGAWLLIDATGLWRWIAEAFRL